MNSQSFVDSLRTDRKPYGRDMEKELGLDISPSDYVPGVICPTCNNQEKTMVEQNGGWWCEVCSTFDGLAHIDTLIDYCMLIDQYISVPQAKWFLQLPSLAKAHDMLSKLQLPKVETSKGTMYHLKPLMHEDLLTKRFFKIQLGNILK